MLSHMDPYIGIVVFELEASPMAAQPSFPKDPDSDESQAVTVRYIVDVAPTLYDNIHEDCDLYSRHFASLSDYKRFEMKLGGLDPLTGTTHPEP